mmetsp:Transcript_3636/g.13048  ORF Transcript_3636/g.13048 Transcript_3636/m.13048 type:complete len:249 (+) Transcript_3636:1205-1951(+)
MASMSTMFLTSCRPFLRHSSSISRAVSISAALSAGYFCREHFCGAASTASSRVECTSSTHCRAGPWKLFSACSTMARSPLSGATRCGCSPSERRQMARMDDSVSKSSTPSRDTASSRCVSSAASSRPPMASRPPSPMTPVFSVATKSCTTSSSPATITPYCFSSARRWRSSAPRALSPSSSASSSGLCGDEEESSSREARRCSCASSSSCLRTKHTARFSAAAVVHSCSTAAAALVVLRLGPGAVNST